MVAPGPAASRRDTIASKSVYAHCDSAIALWYVSVDGRAFDMSRVREVVNAPGSTWLWLRYRSLRGGDDIGAVVRHVGDAPSVQVLFDLVAGVCWVDRRMVARQTRHELAFEIDRCAVRKDVVNDLWQLVVWVLS